MTPDKPAPARSRRLLPVVILLMLLSALAMWGASALTWVSQRYRTPFSGEITAGLTGSQVRPELAPLALATLAAVAAVLATGGWLRRVVGLLVVAEGVLIGWRAGSWQFGGGQPPPVPGVPAGSTPLGELGTNPAGPALALLGACTLLAAGLLVMLRSRRMPAMGAKYSAPGTVRQRPRDPDKHLWESLDAGEDPTDDRERDS